MNAVMCDSTAMVLHWMQQRATVIQSMRERFIYCHIIWRVTMELLTSSLIDMKKFYKRDTHIDDGFAIIFILKGDYKCV